MIPSGSGFANCFCQPVLGVARPMGSYWQAPSDIFDIAWQAPKQRSYKEVALESGEIYIVFRDSTMVRDFLQNILSLY